ncbi:MAG TPA: hypothetical protein EYQ86_02020 [Bacteroidetes bacterium]|nr:hypothetical protein [Bacteroidota bacterium]
MDIEKGRTYSVFYSEKEKNGAWSKPKIMDKPVNISGSSSRFPSLHESVSGRKMLFFSSSRNGGSGGYDIYYAELDDDFKPISILSAKENVNTSGHEIAPYYNEKESSLYFSSDSYEGSGYFDIIMSEGLPEKEFKKARPLSAKVNSSADETQFYIEPETGRQYVLSNKLGEPFGVKATFSIEKDISENVIHDDRILDEAQFNDQKVLGKELVYNLKIRVYDKLTKRSIGGGVVMFVKSKGDESINKSGPGKQYTIKGEQEIIFMVKKENYEDHKFRVSTISKDASEDIIIDVYLRHKLNEDEKAYEYLIEHCGNLKKADMKYMVQIGAFRSRKIKHFESLNLGYKIFEQQLQGLYKYMVYNAETPFEIDNIRQDVINQGISDAFVVPYNKGLRISVKKALKILIPNLDKNEEFISFPIPDK